MDNETSKQLEEYCKLQNIAIQDVPPGNHRANKAERAIRTFANHLIATLATTDPSFPLGAWDLILPQVEMTLNLMRASHVTDQLSAWAQLHGPYSFAAHPIAPLGARVTVHERPQGRAAYGAHGIDGFYIGCALQHYRSHQVFIPSTGATRITDTVEWHLHRLVLPMASPADRLCSSIEALTKTLKQMIAPATTWPAGAS